MKKDWFVDWFNTDEYLSVYKHRNEKDAECHIKFLLSKINLPSNASILDLACGSGRHSILLAKQGYYVTGVDLSDRLLKEAVKSAKAENLDIKFIKADMFWIFINDEMFWIFIKTDMTPISINLICVGYLS
ncbi:MAG: class I SAM-dependent methyltransferase, partial [Ignavibacterium sp.]|nr:class I SAM-dependent methyltransferase [Ignavibacterium sp.]